MSNSEEEEKALHPKEEERKGSLLLHKREAGIEIKVRLVGPEVDQEEERGERKRDAEEKAEAEAEGKESAIGQNKRF